MRCRKLLSIVVFIFLTISTNVNAYQLDVVQESISFTPDAVPLVINLRVLNKGKAQRWDSKKLRSLSSKITVKDSTGRSLGQGSSVGLTFVPNGTSEDRLFYNLVGVVDRKITENQQLVIFISFQDNPELSDMVIVDIPSFPKESKGLEERSTKGVSKAEFNESISSLESTVTNLMWTLASSMGLAFILFFLVLRKSNSVTEDVGDEIKKRQLHNHYELVNHGKDILQTSEKIQWDTEALKAVTTKIDGDIQNFSKDPEKYRKRVKADLVKFNDLVENITSASKLNNDGLSEWILAIGEEREASDAKVDELASSINYFVQHVGAYHEAVLSMERYVSGLEYSSYEDRRKAMRDEVGEILMEYEAIPVAR